MRLRYGKYCALASFTAGAVTAILIGATGGWNVVVERFGAQNMLVAVSIHLTICTIIGFLYGFVFGNVAKNFVQEFVYLVLFNLAVMMTPELIAFTASFDEPGKPNISPVRLLVGHLLFSTIIAVIFSKLKQNYLAGEELP